MGDVQVLTARKNRPQDSFGRSISGTSSTGAGGPSSRLAPPPHANLPPQQQHQAPPPPAQPQQPSYLDAITELQQVLQGVKAELRKHHITSKHVFPVRWVVQFSRSINTNILAAGKSSSLLMGLNAHGKQDANCILDNVVLYAGHGQGSRVPGSPHPSAG